VARDTDLYRRLLGLESPWTVDRVDLDIKTRQVHVYAKHEKPKARPSQGVFRTLVDDADDKIVYDRFHIVGQWTLKETLRATEPRHVPRPTSPCFRCRSLIRPPRCALAVPSFFIPASSGVGLPTTYRVVAQAKLGTVTRQVSVQANFGTLRFPCP
jgi:hypothetical protein